MQSYTHRKNFSILNLNNEKEIKMANCSEMKEGEVFICEKCGLELRVVTPCSCDINGTGKCTVPLQCCGQEMIKKTKATVL
jgi:hypothetical protein